MNSCRKAIFILYPVLALSLFPYDVSASDIENQWKQFYTRAWKASELKVNRNELKNFPKELLHSSSQYPHFQVFSWQDIELIWEVADSCKPPDTVSKRLRSAVEFELALCSNKTLDDTWFKNNYTFHPAGESYADRYILRYPSAVKLPNVRTRFTINNPEHPLHNLLNDLTFKGVDFLLKGYKAYIVKGDIWLNGNSGWKFISQEKWLPIADSFGLEISDKVKGCSFYYSNICVNRVPPTENRLKVALAIVSTLLLVVCSRALYVRRQQQHERRFLLELLTHELRTPIASLGYTVELLKDNFNSMEENTQYAIGRLMSDHQRLTQLTEASKTYLSHNREEKYQSSEAYLSEWLDFITNKFGLSYSLSDDRYVSLPYYWLTICLENLIKNAMQHGSGNIEISVFVSTKLIIEVKDEGEFPNIYQRVSRAFRPRGTEKNMGIGLSVVSRLMRKVGGRLRISRNPTRCILELRL
ncbi:sensor histidine kinase [Vibrio sp. S4M6]|uniref:ATP-binding protein n=1 Tax=Vibrio sinus TaxID=2946865 RepID=UPI00202A6B28|nr:DUF3404 domain-containing protein [Vibrio sinus]MCL9781296.1 sensor histidine kinase [Vibrio sinus]